MRSERGTTLVELLVASAVALLVVLAVGDIELAVLRYQQTDEERFTGQAGANLTADLFMKDVRYATAVALVDGAPEISVTAGSDSITFYFDASMGNVLRQTQTESRVITRGVQSLHFFRESDGRTVRMELAIRPDPGPPYRLVARAAPRPQQ